MRSLLYLAGQIASALLFSPIAILCTAVPSLPRARIIGVWARFNIWTLRRVCGITCEVRGLENIPSRPAVLLSNHQSAWETLYFQLVFPPQSYILKAQLLWIPFFGWGLAANRPVAINRSKKFRALEQLLTQGAIRLREGRWVVAFPEGTRMRPGMPGKFQAGGALLAVRNGAPVVPVAHNAGVFWPKNGFAKYPGVIQLRIGAPIESAGRKPQEVNALAQAWVHKTARALPQSRA
ncbi:MAG: 1-acyl-sn-glycerol-3-phosphate acyltransferase [Gammaproteobacteria bacterium]